ncbi:MAG TPA: tetratricopeptide repeat protein [Pirellulaceae bacterium]|nr:tetratricopeptide repeat protein [Pirellulaceae bacterium]
MSGRRTRREPAAKDKPQRRRTLVVLLVVLVGLAVYSVRPLTYQYHFRQARRAFEAREYAAAVAALESAAAWRDSAEAHFWLARTYRHLNRPDRFTRHLQQAVQRGLAPELAEREQLLAVVQSGQIAMSDPRVAPLFVASDEDYFEVHDAMVRGAFETFDTELALRLIDSWQQGFPQDPEPYVLRGMYFVFVQQWSAAEAEFREALERGSDRRDARLGLAKALREQNRFAEALREYRQCLASEPDADVWFGIGECLKMQGSLEAARAAWERGLAADANHYDCLLALGELELLANRWPAALRLLEQAVALKPHEFNVRYALAKTLLFSGSDAAAADQFRLAADAQQAATRVAALSTYVAEHPDDLEKRFEIAEILLSHGQTQVGLSWLRGILHLDPNHAAARRRIAEITP